MKRLAVTIGAMRMDRITFYWLAWEVAALVAVAVRLLILPVNGVVIAFVTATSAAVVLLQLVEVYRISGYVADHHPAASEHYRVDWRLLAARGSANDLGDPELRKRLDEYDRFRTFAITVLGVAFCWALILLKP
ncbi:MAG TPA: hypothetical protein VEU30_02355 [Thermoanaerobaculia bacterium]|nr:hypothetical protein [Thermoanaerobaculia bacterium]